jgi:SSS family solute:Na+ symporter
MRRLKASEGDLLYLADARRYLGGLRSIHAKAGAPHDRGDVALISPAAFSDGNFVRARRVRIEKFF